MHHHISRSCQTIRLVSTTSTTNRPANLLDSRADVNIGQSGQRNRHIRTHSDCIPIAIVIAIVVSRFVAVLVKTLTSYPSHWINVHTPLPSPLPFKISLKVLSLPAPASGLVIEPSKLVNCGVGAEETVTDKAQRAKATKLVERMLMITCCGEIWEPVLKRASD